MGYKEAFMDKNLKSQQRRSLIKGFLAAGAAAFAGVASAKKAKASVRQTAGRDSEKEILYRETEEFKAYYDSLLD